MARLSSENFESVDVYARAMRLYENGGHSKGFSLPELITFIKNWEEITGKFK